MQSPSLSNAQARTVDSPLMFIHSLIHSFSRYLLRTYYTLGAVFNTGRHKEYANAEPEMMTLYFLFLKKIHTCLYVDFLIKG